MDSLRAHTRRVRRRFAVAAALCTASTLLPVGLPGTAAPQAFAATSTPVFTTAFGVGSQTTESMLDTLANSLTIQSLPAINSIATSGSATIATKGGNCIINRPANDDQGYAALMESANARNGCVDFARMSHPYTGAFLSGTAMDYVPFALDGLSFAVTSSSQLPASLTKAQLRQIYTCDPAAAGYKGLLPAEGSEQRQMWLAALGIADADVLRGAYPCVSDHNSSGQAYGDNNAAVLDNWSVMPFSIGSYVSQSGGSQIRQMAGARIGTISDQAQPPVLANSAAYPGDVTFAVTGTSNIPSHLSMDDLWSIYTCGQPGVTPMLPAAGAVRTAFEDLLQLQDKDVVAGKYPCITTSSGGTAVQQNAGGVLGASSIIPFSISSYVNQLLNKQPDQRGQALLGVIDDTGAPMQGPLPMTMNTAYGQPFVYHLYDAMQHAGVDTSPLNETFIGANSLVCKSTSIIASRGFAPIPATDAEPCGTLQHSVGINGLPTTAPTTAAKTGAASTATTADSSAGEYIDYPLAPQDYGLLPGSGGWWYAQNGGCYISGGFSNDPGNLQHGVSGTFAITGPHCHGQVVTRYISASTGAPVAGETLDQDCSGPCQLNLLHNGPGYSMLRFPNPWGVAANGDVLIYLSMNVVDDSLGGVGFSTTIIPFGQPGVARVIAWNPNQDTVNLTWTNVTDATQYAVERLAEGTNAWSLVATVPEIPQVNMSWGDTNVVPGTKYTYRVSAYNGSILLGAGPSFPVSVVPQAPTRLKHYVAMGDSYSSGMGATDHFLDSSNCRRSFNSYAGKLQDALDSTPVSQYAENNDARWEEIACSGARSYNMLSYLPNNGNPIIGQIQGGMEPWRTHTSDGGYYINRGYIAADFQVDMLAEAARRDVVDYVTLTAGGDDVGFASVFSDCVQQQHGCVDSNLPSYEANLKAQIDGLGPRLTDLYEAVVRASGYANVDVIGYPLLFPDNAPDDCAISTSAWLAGNIFTTAHLDTAQMNMLNRMGNELDGVISNAVTAANAAVGYVRFLDVRNLFQGHDMCAGGNAYIHQILPQWNPIGADPQSGHPNDAGYAAEAALIQQLRFNSGS